MSIKDKDYNPGLHPGYGGTSDDSRFSDLGDLLDVNGAKILEFDAVTSAVNYLRIANGVTGSPAVITATGTDTIVDLQLTSTGTAKILIGDFGSAVVAGGSAAVNTQRGIITTGSLSTGSSSVGNASASFDLLNTKIVPGCMIMTQVMNGSNSGGIPTQGKVTLGTAGSAKIEILNVGSSAFNGTLRVSFIIV